MIEKRYCKCICSCTVVVVFIALIVVVICLSPDEKMVAAVANAGAIYITALGAVITIAMVCLAVEAYSKIARVNRDLDKIQSIKKNIIAMENEIQASEAEMVRLAATMSATAFYSSWMYMTSQSVESCLIDLQENGKARDADALSNWLTTYKKHHGAELNNYTSVINLAERAVGILRQKS